MNLLEELLYFYYVYEKHENYLNEKEAEEYHRVLIEKDRITAVEEAGRMAAYCESWRVNFGQFGRIICGLPFNVKEEDIESGPILYVANVCIRPKSRGLSTIRKLRRNLFYRNQQCEYFVGEARRKKSAPLKVFKKQEALNQWTR
jgi:hypothetical protein